MRISVITPEQTAYESDADMLIAPTAMGEITILPHHIALVTTLAPGTMIIRSGRDEQMFAVSRGIIEVSGEHVRVLTDIADRAENLQEAAIEQAKAAAEKLKTERRSDSEGFAEATAILDRELARLKSVRRHRARRGGLSSLSSHQ